MMQLKIKTDVLIIGGGGSGLRAAIAAADCGVQVMLVSKRKVGIAGATAYPVAEMAGYNAGNINIPGDVHSHYEDIMNAAQEMSDPKLAAIVAANAPKTISKLEEWGVKFEHVEDDYYIFKSCFFQQAPYTCDQRAWRAYYQGFENADSTAKRKYKNHGRSDYFAVS